MQYRLGISCLKILRKNTDKKERDIIFVCALKEMDLIDESHKAEDNIVLPPGTVVSERYRIVRHLGSGGMGSVYLASDCLLNEQEVALKILHPAMSCDPTVRERFIREIELTRIVGHPNIVRTYDVGVDGALNYFTMEYVLGESLGKVDRTFRYDENALADLILKICSALNAIHENGILHRDLKPDNILMTPGMQPKITDFGVARKRTSRLTEPEMILGSVEYLAPEIWEGEEITKAVDYYSLGVILYELTTDQNPFAADAPATIMWKHLSRMPAPPDELDPDLPKWLSPLVMRLLKKVPGERLSSYDEIIEFIERGLALGENFERKTNAAVNSDINTGSVGDNAESGAWNKLYFGGNLPTQEEIREHELHIREKAEKKLRKTAGGDQAGEEEKSSEGEGGEAGDRLRSNKLKFGIFSMIAVAVSLVSILLFQIVFGKSSEESREYLEYVGGTSREIQFEGANQKHIKSRPMKGSTSMPMAINALRRAKRPNKISSNEAAKGTVGKAAALSWKSLDAKRFFAELGFSTEVFSPIEQRIISSSQQLNTVEVDVSRREAALEKNKLRQEIAVLEARLGYLENSSDRFIASRREQLRVELLSVNKSKQKVTEVMASVIPAFDNWRELAQLLKAKSLIPLAAQLQHIDPAIKAKLASFSKSREGGSKGEAAKNALLEEIEDLATPLVHRKMGLVVIQLLNGSLIYDVLARHERMLAGEIQYLASLQGNQMRSTHYTAKYSAKIRAQLERDKQALEKLAEELSDEEEVLIRRVIALEHFDTV